MKNVLLIIFIMIAGVCKGQKLELVIPAGHADGIVATAISPDNKYIISSDGFGVTKIWEKSSGKLLFNFPLKTNGKPYSFSKFFFCKSGKELIAMGSDLVVFDFQNFVILKEMALQSFVCAVITTDETTLFISSQEQMYHAEIKKLNLENFSIQTIYAIEDADDFNVSFKRISLNKKENKLLCYTQHNGSVLIDTSGTLIKKFPSDNKHAVWCFAPDGLLAEIEETGFTQNTIKFLDPETYREIWRTTIQFKNYFSFYYNFQIAEFDAHHGTWILASQESFAVLDYVNHKLLKVYNTPKAYIRSICATADMNNYIIGTPKSSGVFLYNYNTTTNEVFQEYGSAVLEPYSIKTPVFNKTILIGSFAKYFKQIDILKGRFTIKNLSHKYGSQKIGVSPDGKIGISAASPFINFYSTNDSGDEYTEVNTAENESSPNEIIFSKDGKLLASINDREVVVVDVNTKTLLRRFKIGKFSKVSKQGLGEFSNSNKEIISYSINDDSDPTITCFSIKSGKMLWSKKGEIYSFKFLDDDKSIFCIDHDNNKALWLSTQDGSLIKEKSLNIEKGAIGNTIYTNDFKHALINVKNKIEIWNLETFEKTYELKGHSEEVNYTAFLDDNKYLISSSYDNTVRLWDWKNNRELCKFVFFEESEGWVALMPDGRFDASEDVMKKMYYVRGKEIIPLESIYEKFYTPLLVNRIFNGEQFKPLDVDINTIKQKPTVKISYASLQRNLEIADDNPLYTNTTGLAELTINATSQDDKVDEIRLFHNGKIVNLATRGLFVIDNDGSETKKYSINLLPGQNTFRAVALNQQRTESKADEITVNYKTTENNTPVDKPIDLIDKTATLHLIVVGINQYQNKKMSLNYALADATSFKDELEKDVKSVIANVKTYFVTDDAASKKGITDAFAAVQQNAKPQDVFIFYYAGHGVIGKDKEFYLVPTDVSDLANVQTELEQKGIPSKLLQQYAIDIQAQKQLFILDACQSAGAFETLMSNDGNQQKSLAVVARSTGTHWMAASGAKQYANEFASLGHGVFTYILLQALKGEAASNKQVTVNGLKNFLQIQVPALMKKYNGEEQYPASYGFGNDFPVEVVK